MQSEDNGMIAKDGLTSRKNGLQTEGKGDGNTQEHGRFSELVEDISFHN